MKIHIMYINAGDLNQVVTLPKDYETKTETFEALCELCESYEKDGFKRTYQKGFYHWLKNYETGEVRGIFVTGYLED